MSNFNNIDKQELRSLVQEGLIDWLMQAKDDLETQGVNFSDGVDGEEIGTILSYGGDKLKGAFDDILSRFGGDELGSEEAIEAAAEEIEDADLEATPETRRRSPTAAEVQRVKENYKYVVIKGTKNYGSLDNNEKQLYDTFFQRSGSSLREQKYSSQPMETLEDIFMLVWNIVDEVFDGTIDFIEDFSEAVFEDCIEWEEHDEQYGMFTVDWGEKDWNPLNWIPDVGLVDVAPNDVDFGCMPLVFFEHLWKNLKKSAKQINRNTMITALDLFGVNDPYPEWINRLFSKMEELGLIAEPTLVDRASRIGSDFLSAAGDFLPENNTEIADSLRESLQTESSRIESSLKLNKNISFKEFEKAIQKDITIQQKLRK